MKICYIDESFGGRKGEIGVVANVMLDTTRMKKTKTQWNDLREDLSKILTTNLEEIHTTDLYIGCKQWEKVSRERRFSLIDHIIKYINERKHKILFTAIDINKLNDLQKDDKFAQMLNIKILQNTDKSINPYRLAALHIALCVQKLGVHEKKNKGDSLLIFDQKDNTIIDIIGNPPIWAHQYYLSETDYKKIKKQGFSLLPNIIDMPYLADSKKVLPINIADFYAYFITRYASLKEGIQKPNTSFDEIGQVTKWIQEMSISFVDDSNRWMARGRNECQELFYQIAPDALKTIKKDMIKK